MFKGKKILKTTFFSLLLIFPISIFSKFYQYTFLSKQSLTDSSYILSLMRYNVEKEGTAFYVTAEIFKKLNFFNFTTLLEWSLLIAAVFTFISFIILLKTRKYDLRELIFIYSSFVLINFYVFNISKDIIQFFIFIIAYFIIISKKISFKWKAILVALIFVLEAKYFRPYYIIIAFGFLLSIFVLNVNSKKENSNRKVIKTFILTFLIFVMALAIVQKIMPYEYDKIVNVREDVTSVLNANTEINNLFNGSSFIVFILNYLINGIRIFFPIELVFKGLKYSPFVIYQLYVSYLIISSVKSKNKNIILPLSVIIGYFLGSIIYEPDFGSVVRHEVTLIFFYVYLNHEKKLHSKKIENNNSSINFNSVDKETYLHEN